LRILGIPVFFLRAAAPWNLPVTRIGAEFYRRWLAIPIDTMPDEVMTRNILVTGSPGLSKSGEPDRKETVLQKRYHVQVRLAHLFVMKIQIATVTIHGSES
jgi:hypothetical protein